MLEKVDAVRANKRRLNHTMSEIRTLVIWYKFEGDALVLNPKATAASKVHRHLPLWGAYFRKFTS